MPRILSSPRLNVLPAVWVAGLVGGAFGVATAQDRVVLPPGEIIDPIVFLPDRNLQVDEFSVSITPSPEAILPGQSVNLNVHLAASTDFLLGWPRPTFDARVSVVVTQWCGFFSFCEIARVPLPTLVHFEPADVRMRGLFELQAQDVSMPLNDEAAWIAIASARAGFLTAVSFEVRLDSEDVVGEGGTVATEVTDNLAAVAAPALPLPLSGRLNYGPAATTLTSVSAVDGPSGVCPAGTWELLAGTSGLWDPGTSWDEVAWEVNPAFGNHLCASALYNADAGRFDLAATDARVGFETATGTFGGRDLRLFFLFDETGATPLLTAGVLPPWHSLHGDAGGRPLPRGVGALLFNQFFPSSGLGDFDGLSMTSTVPLWLQARDLPFSFLLGDYRLDSLGLTLGYAAVHYQNDLPYSVLDERRVSWKGPKTNDIRFVRPVDTADQPDTSLTLDAAGIAGHVVFDASFGRTHFPQTQTRFEKFALDLRDGEIAGAQPLGRSEYEMSLRTTCAECGTATGTDVAYSIASDGAERITRDGSTMLRTSVSGDAAWGPSLLEGLLNVNVFRRLDDAGLRGIFFLPGFRIARSDADPSRSPVDSLLGMRGIVPEGDAFGPADPNTHDFLTYDEARRGNRFMAGLTVGPEFYSTEVAGNQNQPLRGVGENLAGTRTRIALGGVSAPVFETVRNNAGTKYVVRPGGVTGVFNTDDADAPSPDVYGYDMDFHRFAYRMVSNRLDSYSWIDGRVNVPGRGGFNVPFDALTLTCTGALGGGSVPGGTPGQDLDAWRTRFKLRGMSFQAAAGADACTDSNRELHTRMRTDVKALSAPLDLDAAWTPVGEPISAKVTGSTLAEVDRGVSGPGFKLQIKTVALGGDAGEMEGWFDLRGTMLLPFWNALKSAVRVENRTADAAEKSAVLDESLVAGVAGWASEPNSTVVSALAALTYPLTYRWIADFELSLPVRYDGTRLTSEPPRFVGKKQSKDLSVIVIDGGIDHVDPTRTKVSFGASADIEKIRASVARVQIDLGDPESLTRADAFIDGLLPGPDVHPFTTGAGALQSALTNVLDHAGEQLDDFMENGIREQIRSVIHTPVQLAAAQITAVQSLPGRAIDLVFEPLHGAVDAAISPLAASLDAQVMDLYTQIPAAIETASNDLNTTGTLSNPALIASLRAKAAELKAAMGLVDSGLDTLYTKTTQAKTAIEALRGQVDGIVDPAVAQLDTLDAALDTLGFATCENLSGLTGDAANPIVKRIRQVRDEIDGLVGALKDNQIINIALQVASLVGVDTSIVENARRDIRELAEDLEERVSAAVAEINDALACGTTGIASVLDEAHTLLAGIRTVMVNAKGQFKAAIDDIVTPVPPAFDAFGGTQAAIILVRSQSSKLVQVADRMVGDLDRLLSNTTVGLELGITAVDVQAALDGLLSSSGLAWTYPIAGPPTHTIVRQLALFITLFFDGFIDSVASMTHARMASVISAMPFPNAEEMEEHVTNMIMTSPAIEAVDRAVHEGFVFVSKSAGDIVGHFTDQANTLLQAVVDHFNALVAGLLSAANGALSAVPVKAAKLDGFATINGNDLERLHIGAEWTMNEGAQTGTTYSAALDVSSWSANGKGAACGLGAGAGLLDAVITAYNLPMKIGSSGLTLKKIYLGFTLAGLSPVAVFGGLETAGKLTFQAFKLFDMALMAGLSRGLPSGDPGETYLGAKASAQFDDVAMKAAFLLGRVCDPAVFQAIDPQVSEFLGLTEAFNGVFVRGGASFPIWKNGCALTVGVGADVGAWYLQGSAGESFGGLVGGEAWGQALCIASLKGSVTTMGQYDGSFSFQGSGWGGAGVGWCSPEDWHSVADVRDDGWCGTGDAQFKASYKSGDWSVSDLHTSAID